MQICKQNRLARSPGILERLQAAGWLVEVEECLDECTRCQRIAIALVAGRLEWAHSTADLIALLEQPPDAARRRRRRGLPAGKDLSGPNGKWE